MGGVLIADNKLWNYVLAGCAFFCAAGGVLAVAGTSCYLLLIIVIVKSYSRRVKKADFIIFILTVTGAIVNVLAPGNYVRHSIIDESGLHPFRALIFSVSEVIITGEWLFLETPFLVICLIALFIGAYEGKDKKSDNTFLVLVMMLTIFVPIVAYYPVCLGYSSGGGPNRCRFVLTVSFVFAAIIVFVLFGKMVAKYIDVWFYRIAVSIILCLLIIMPTQYESWKLSSLVPYKTLMQLTEGKIQSYYRDANEIYASIAKDANEDVFIWSTPEDVEGFLSMDLAQNPEDLRNTECAAYYGKRSVHVVNDPVYVTGEGKIYVRISPEWLTGDLTYVSIFKTSDSGEIDEIQVLQPFEKNLVLEIPAGESGTVSIYVFTNAEGEDVVDELTLSY